MRVISWNVAGYRAVVRKENLQELIEEYEPDVLMLQEVKCQKHHVPWLPDGYTCWLNSGQCAGFHGTMLMVKDGNEKPLVENDSYYIDGKTEGRMQIAIFSEIAFMNSYTVNSREGLTRLETRLAYDTMLRERLEDLRFCQKVILAGDLNCTHEGIDYHAGVLNPFMACQSPAEIGSFERILDVGLVDIFRHREGEKREYTYWSNLGKARQSNKGWRLDYFLVDEDLVSAVTDYRVLHDIYGSDHAPILLELSV